MRKIVLVFTAVVFTASGFAQKSADIGIWGGTSTYFGDIKEAPPIQTFNLNFGAFFRYNFNARVALRTQFLTGSFAADGMVEDVPFQFKKNVQDVSLMMEINYLKYILGDKQTPFTPYILGGLGVMYFPYELIGFDSSDTNYPGNLDKIEQINPDNPLVKNEKKNRNESVIAPALAFGFGIKFSVGPRVGVGIEYQMRKLFDDRLDDLDDPLSFETENSQGVTETIVTETIKYTDFLHNNDWPGYLGINVTYKINLDPKACPAYDRKYW